MTTRKPSKDVIQRSYLLRFLSRLRKQSAMRPAEVALIDHIRDWVKAQTKRSRKPGGLAR